MTATYTLTLTAEEARWVIAGLKEEAGFYTDDFDGQVPSPEWLGVQALIERIEWTPADRAAHFPHEHAVGAGYSEEFREALAAHLVDEHGWRHIVGLLPPTATLQAIHAKGHADGDWGHPSDNGPV